MRGNYGRGNYGAEIEGLNVGHFAGSDAGHVPKRHTGYGTAPRPANTSAPLTRRFLYHGDKLSRLALLYEMIERHSPCRIKGLTEEGGDGAHFAEATGVHLTYLQWAPGRKGRLFGVMFGAPIFIPQVNSVADLNNTV